LRSDGWNDARALAIAAKNPRDEFQLGSRDRFSEFRISSSHSAPGHLRSLSERRQEEAFLQRRIAPPNPRGPAEHLSKVLGKEIAAGDTVADETRP
jgi:hypothetical protein